MNSCEVWNQSLQKIRKCPKSAELCISKPVLLSTQQRRMKLRSYDLFECPITTKYFYLIHVPGVIQKAHLHTYLSTLRMFKVFSHTYSGIYTNFLKKIMLQFNKEYIQF